MNHKAVGFVLIVLAAGLLLLRDSELPFRIRLRPSVPAVVVPEACRVPVEAIRALSISGADARELAAFYEAFASAVQADADGLLKDAETVREFNRRCGALCFEKKGLFGKYPGLAAHVDETIAAAVGSRKDAVGRFEAVVLEEPERQNLARALRAIAWAVRN